MIMETTPTYYDDEISLVDVIRFLIRQGKVITLATLGLAIASITPFLLQPTQYKKTISLSIEPKALQKFQGLGNNSLDNNTASGNPQGIIPYATKAEVNEVVAVSLETEEKDQSYPQAELYQRETSYDSKSGSIEIALVAPDIGTIQDIVWSEFQAVVLQDLQRRVQSQAQQVLETMAYQLEQKQQALLQLEQEISLLQANRSESTRLEALEAQRSQVVMEIAALEFDVNTLGKELQTPAVLFAQAYGVNLIVDPRIQEVRTWATPPKEEKEQLGPIIVPQRSPLQIVVLYVIASFMVSVIGALIWDSVPRIRAELAATPSENPDQQEK